MTQLSSESTIPVMFNKSRKGYDEEVVVERLEGAGQELRAGRGGGVLDAADAVPSGHLPHAARPVQRTRHDVVVGQ